MNFYASNTSTSPSKGKSPRRLNSMFEDESEFENKRAKVESNMIKNGNKNNFGDTSHDIMLLLRVKLVVLLVVVLQLLRLRVVVVVLVVRAAGEFVLPVSMWNHIRDAHKSGFFRRDGRLLPFRPRQEEQQQEEQQQQEEEQQEEEEEEHHHHQHEEEKQLQLQEEEEEKEQEEEQQQQQEEEQKQQQQEEEDRGDDSQENEVFAAKVGVKVARTFFEEKIENVRD